MRPNRACLGDIIELRRNPIDVDVASTYRQVGVRGFGRGLFEYEPVAGSDLGKLRFFKLEPDRLVVSNIKGWEGAVATTMGNESGRIVSNRFLTYATSGRADLAYLAHWLLSDKGIEALGRASPGSADRNRTLSIKNFEALEVPLPDLPEQQRIAAHLDDIEKRTRELTIYATSGWLPMLPKITGDVISGATLDLVSVAELCTNVNRTIHPGDDHGDAREFVGLEYVEPHTGRSIGFRSLGDETGRKLKFQPGELTYGYLRPYQNKVWVADRKGLCSVEQYVLIPQPGVDPELLGFALRSNQVLDLAKAATHNLQLPRLRLGQLMSFLIPDIRTAGPDLLPKLQKLSQRIVLLHGESAKADRLKRGILPAARNEIFSALQ